MRYLTPEQATTNLRVGKTVEQLLGAAERSDGKVLRWVSVGRRDMGDYEVTLFEAFEDERAAYDLYGLYAVEADEDGAAQQVYGAGKSRRFDGEEAAVAYVCESLGGSPDRFLNSGFLEDEYRERFAAAGAGS